MLFKHEKITKENCLELKPNLSNIDFDKFKMKSLQVLKTITITMK